MKVYFTTYKFDHSTKQPICQPTKQPISEPTNQPSVDQPTNQPGSQSAILVNVTNISMSFASPLNPECNVDMLFTIQYHLVFLLILFKDFLTYIRYIMPRFFVGWLQDTVDYLDVVLKKHNTLYIYITYLLYSHIFVRNKILFSRLKNTPGLRF